MYSQHDTCHLLHKAQGGKSQPAVVCTSCTRCRVGDKSGTVRVPGQRRRMMISFLFWHHSICLMVLYMYREKYCLWQCAHLSLNNAMDRNAAPPVKSSSVIISRDDVSQRSQRCESRKLGRQTTYCNNINPLCIYVLCSRCAFTHSIPVLTLTPCLIAARRFLYVVGKVQLPKPTYLLEDYLAPPNPSSFIAHGQSAESPPLPLLLKRRFGTNLSHTGRSPEPQQWSPSSFTSLSSPSRLRLRPVVADRFLIVDAIEL